MRPCRANVYAVAALAVGVLMAGTAWAQDEKPKADARNALDPKNAVWTVKLTNIYADKPATLHLATTDGKVVRAFGLGEFNKALHDVDASGLVAGENSLKGPVRLTVNADQWVPPGGKSIECQFDLDVAVKGGNLGGTYKGKRASDDFSGLAVGTIQAPAKAIRGTISLECERALDGQPNFQRVLLNVPVTDGKVGEVKAAAKDSFHWKARVKDNKLAVTPEALTGDLVVEVYDVQSVTAGLYTFTFDGKVIGNKVAGKFKSKLGDREIRESAMFTGNLK